MLYEEGRFKWRNLSVLGCAMIPRDDFKVLGIEKATTDEDNEEEDDFKSKSLLKQNS